MPTRRKRDTDHDPPARTTNGALGGSIMVCNTFLITSIQIDAT
jgi:hypothetical protein